MNSSFNKLLTFKILMIILIINVFFTNFLLIERVDALSDSKQLVLDAWTLVNEGFMIQKSLMKFNGKELDKKHYRNKLKQVKKLILQLKIC